MSAVLPQEGVWRHAETGAVLDLAELWTPGQPNGAKVQNCASVWEFVSTNILLSVITPPPAQDGGYDDGSCDTEQQCSLCRFGLHPRAALRGVCAAARWSVT